MENFKILWTLSIMKLIFTWWPSVVLVEGDDGAWVGIGAAIGWVRVSGVTVIAA